MLYFLSDRFFRLCWWLRSWGSQKKTRRTSVYRFTDNYCTPISSSFISLDFGPWRIPGRGSPPMHLLQCVGRPCGSWTSLSCAPAQGQHFSWGLPVIRFLTTAQVASDVVYPQMERITRHTVPASVLRRSQSTAGIKNIKNMEPTSSGDMEGLSQSQWIIQLLPQRRW